MGGREGGREGGGSKEEIRRAKEERKEGKRWIIKSQYYFSQ